MPQLYATYEDVVNIGGLRPEDLDELGLEMTETQFKAYIESLIQVATTMINRYCNVPTFVISTTTEYHTFDIGDSFTPIYGMVRGYPGLSYSISLYDYTTDLNKFTIIPREQPVVEVTKVETNMAWSNATPQWITLSPYTDTTEGDYKIVNRYDTTKVTFIKRFPPPSIDNVRITYKYGYAEDHPMWDTIKFCCVLICNNILLYKKKNQEAVTIRGAGIPDYAEMFEINGTRSILTKAITDLLDMYRKDPMAAFTGN